LVVLIVPTFLLSGITSRAVIMHKENIPLTNATNIAPFPQTGSIRGKVVADIPDQRKTLPGVVVTLTGNLAPKPLQSISDDEGLYNFAGLTAGDYFVSVELQGFKKYEERVTVQIEAAVELNILLQHV
jgi:hypothetical protein